MKNKANFCRAIVVSLLNEISGYYHPNFSGKTFTEVLSLCREWYKEKTGGRLTSLEYRSTEIRKYSEINKILYNKDKIKSSLAICININSAQMNGWFIFDANTLEVVSK